MNDTTEVEHNNGCHRPPLRRFRGNRGDALLGCPYCRRFVVLPPDSEVPGPVPEAPARYRCRDHGQPVNWRGKGCARCAAALRGRRKDRRRRPKPEPLEDA